MFSSIPKVTRQLLLINIIVFVTQQLIPPLDFYGSLHYVLSPYFHFYQPFTYMFLHGSVSHLLFNMLALWMFGRSVEPALGSQRFLTFYLVCGLGAALCQELWQTFEYLFLNGTLAPTVGASGAIYGVLLAFGMLYPNDRIMLLFPPIPMKAKYFVVLYAAIELWSAFGTNDNVAHLAHLGGMLFGWGMFRYWRHKANAHLHATRPPYGTRSSSSWTARPTPPPPPPRTPDQGYNAQRNAQEARLDALLDKIRQSGYDSLTEDEKRDLFNNSRR